MTKYYITRLNGPAGHLSFFAVSKFEKGIRLSTYVQVLEESSDTMRCDCPNARSGRAVEDKHCVGVRNWLAAGEPVHAVEIGKSQSRTAPPSIDPDDDIPF